MNQDEAALKIRPAFDTLRELRGGAVLDELAVELNKVTKAVQDTGKKGTVTLTIEVQRMKSETIAVIVNDKIVAKIPERDRSGSIMFVTEDNNLQAEHPKQRKLELREARAPTREVREVPAGK